MIGHEWGTVWSWLAKDPAVTTPKGWRHWSLRRLASLQARETNF
jgi:hypothetical protein